jgi:acyl carrier protein
MEKTEIVTRVNKVLNGLRFETDPEIKPEDNLSKDLEFDSISILEMAFAVEDEFGIEISDTAIEKMKTVQNVYDCVESCLVAK